MPIPATHLKVLVNPYVAVDHKGRPAGAVLLDPVEHHKYRDNPEHPEPAKRFQVRRYVGAKVAAVGETRKAMSVQTNKGKFVVAEARHDHAWEFSKDAVTLPNTLYYRRKILTGELYAADKATWVACGCDAGTFVESKLLLAWSKEGAIAAHVAHHGADLEDVCLQTLAMHWDGHVEQRHPLGKKIAQAHADAKAKAEAEANKAAEEAKAAAEKAEHAAEVAAKAEEN